MQITRRITKQKVSTCSVTELQLFRGLQKSSNKLHEDEATDELPLSGTKRFREHLREGNFESKFSMELF